MKIEDMNWYEFEGLRMQLDLLNRNGYPLTHLRVLIDFVGEQVRETNVFSDDLKQIVIEVDLLLNKEPIMSLYTKCVEAEEKELK